MGPVDVDGEQRWNRHTLTVLARAAQQHAGKRILVLVGVENCYFLRQELRQNTLANLHYVETEAWLRQ